MRIRFRNLNFRMKEIGISAQYRTGEKIILQGRPNHNFFLMVSGRVGVFSAGRPEIQLAGLFPGEYFGEMSCLTGEVSGATYSALDEVTLLRTDREGLLKLLGELPDFNRHIVETFCSVVKGGSRETGVPPFIPGDTGGRDIGGTGDGTAPFRKEGGPGIGLALGAGVVRGMAHIGVIRSLQKHGIPVDMVAGTSAGALVGSCLAAGLTVDRMEEIAKSLRWSKIAAPVLPPGRAFLNNEKLGQLVDRVISGKTFSQLNIPFAVVAADSCTGEEVVIREGRVADAVRASTAIPAIFEPVKLGDRVLMDGAVLNMVPASVCRSMGADIVVAVSVSDFHFQPGSPRNIVMAILRYTDMMLKRQVSLSQNQWADIVISVERPDLSGYSFRETRHFIREGERAANMVIPRIKSLIGAWRG